MSAPQPVLPTGKSSSLRRDGSPEARPESGARRYDPATVFTGLNDAITAGDHHLDVILGAIAVASQGMTEATGAAIAMWKDDAVVCRARSGDTAPPLGSRLSVDSGISGECLRTGQIQICNDTDSDFRVDAEVCRTLGLRSIVALPIQGWRGINGILEVFSTEPRSFTEDHVALLQKLAALAERARATQPHDASAAATNVPVKAPSATAQSTPQNPLAAAGLLPASDRVGDIVSAVIGRRWRPLLVAGACLLGLLLGIAIWLGWHAPDVVNGKTRDVQPAASQALATAQAPDNDPVWKISPSGASGQPAQTDRPSPIRLASKLDLIPTATSAMSRPAPQTSVSGDISIERTPTSGPASARVEPATPEPPPTITLAAGSAPSALSGLLASPSPMPGLGPVAVSQGISDGFLVHRVSPTYPPQALMARLEGAVVLQALIAEDGSVKNVKATNGSQILARAAIDAVRNWRYKPYRLNGKPVQMNTTITVKFKLP